MKFGMGLTTKLTQKSQGQSTRMSCVRPKHIFKNSIVLPLIVSHLLANNNEVIKYFTPAKTHLVFFQCLFGLSYLYIL